LNKEVLILKGCGLDMRVNSGGLQIKDGFAHTGDVRETFINRGLNTVEHIVVLGQSGAVTFEAIKWLVDQNIMVTFLDSDGNPLTRIMPEKDNHISGIVKRRQATASNAVNMKISTWLLSEKLQEQRKVLKWVHDYFRHAGWWNSERDKRINQAISISEDREKMLSTCLNPDSQRVLEAQSAAAYWHCFEGIPLRWIRARKIPVNWQTMGNRTSPKTKSPRKAIEPFHACLNYLYAVLETRVRQTCLINNVDPDFGIIHVDHNSRTSLVFDLMEPVRPKVDRLLFNWVTSQAFNSKDFFETREGVCRISQDTAKQIIPLVKDLTSDITKTVKEFTAFFKDKAVKQRPEDFQRKVVAPKKVNKFQTENKEVGDKQETVFCQECGEAFIPEKPGQEFCCKTHSVTHRKRLQREKRKAEGRCPQCGRPMPEAADGTYKEKVSYCQHCRDYWERRYREKKNSFC